MLVAFEHNGKSFGGDVDFAKLLHALFAFGLFGENFLLTTDVTAVQAGRHILAVGA